MISLLVASIFLGSSVYGGVWPYHGSAGLIPPATGAIIPAGTVDVSLVQPTPLAINLKPSSVATVVAGPNSGATIVKGAVAGPVTIKAGLSATAAVGVLPAVGVNAGSVTVEDPSDGSITVSGASGIAGATTTAVVGPSTGPVVVAGPNAVPAVPPAGIAVPEVVIANDSLGVIENTAGSVVIKGGTIDRSAVLQAGPIASQEILGNTLLVSEPRVKILTPASPVVVASAATDVTVLSPARGNVAVSGLQTSSAVISGPSGIIATSG